MATTTRTVRPTCSVTKKPFVLNLDGDPAYPVATSAHGLLPNELVPLDGKATALTLPTAPATGSSYAGCPYCKDSHLLRCKRCGELACGGASARTGRTDLYCPACDRWSHPEGAHGATKSHAQPTSNARTTSKSSTLSRAAIAAGLGALILAAVVAATSRAPSAPPSTPPQVAHAEPSSPPAINTEMPDVPKFDPAPAPAPVTCP